MRALLFVFVIAGVGACSSGRIDCTNSPIITYANFGESFIAKECQGCHGKFVTGDQRQGAPREFFYDTPERVWEDKELILVTSTGTDPIMPPSGGVFADDQLRLEVWLRCGQDGAIDGIQLEETP